MARSRTPLIVAGAALATIVLSYIVYDQSTDHLPTRVATAWLSGRPEQALAIQEAHQMTSLPDSAASWPQLQAHSKALVQLGAPADDALRSLLRTPTEWQAAAVAEALIDAETPELAAAQLAVLSRLGSTHTWIGEADTVVEALDRAVAVLPREEIGPVLAMMMAVDSAVATRAAHHFDAQPPATAIALLQTLLQTAPTPSTRLRLASSLLKLRDTKAVNARAYNIFRRADLALGLALLEAETQAATPPRFDGDIIEEFVVRLYEVPADALGADEKYPVALFGYPQARAQLVAGLSGKPSNTWTTAAALLLAHQPTEAEHQAIAQDVSLGHLPPGLLTPDQPALSRPVQAATTPVSEPSSTQDTLRRYLTR